MNHSTTTIPRRATRAARLVRAGLGVRVPESGAVRDAGLAMSGVLAALRQGLDDAHRAEILTPHEKRQAAAKATKTAAEAWPRAMAKLDQAAGAVRQRLQALDDLAVQLEGRVGPLGIERVRQRADGLRRLDPIALAEADRQAKAAGDLEHFHARAIMAPDSGSIGRRLLLEAVRPEQVAQVRAEVDDLAALIGRAATLGAGVAELAQIDDAHDLGDLEVGADLLEEANDPRSALVPVEWPAWAR